MLSFLAENRIPILAYHFAWPGYGHFVKQGEGFRYLPAAMNMTAPMRMQDAKDPKRGHRIMVGLLMRPGRARTHL